MKVCDKCSIEFSEDSCPSCAEHKRNLRNQRNASRRRQRYLHEAALRDMGLVKVRGALGGTYWE